jgi:hypothetical protein
MELVKLATESQPVVEALDNEKVVIAQQNGIVTVVYLNSDKILSVELNAEAVQIEIRNSSIYVSTKPFEIVQTADNEESEEVLANNLLASRKTGSTLWKIDIIENALVVNNTFEHAGGFAINEDKIYACNILSYGFYVLSLTLIEIEKIFVQIEPSDRRPWHSMIVISDNVLFLIQEEARIRWFTLGDKIEEMGIVEPEFIHKTCFLSVSATPKKVLKVGSYILGILTFGEPFVISMIDGKPAVAVDPKTIFTLIYKDGFEVMDRIQAVSDQYALGMNRDRIMVTDETMNAVLHGFYFDEVDDGLNLTRVSAFGKYAVCFAWTYSRKYPVIIFDLSKPQEPVIVKIVDCGIESGEIKVDIDEW